MTVSAAPEQGQADRRIDRRPLAIVIAALLVLLTIGILSRLNNADASPDTTNDARTAPAQSAQLADWQSAVYRATQIENQLFANPDPSRVGEIMTDDCACSTDTRTRLLMLQQAGRHVQGDNIHVDSVTLNQQISATEVRAFVVVSDSSQPTVDHDGKVVAQSPHVDHTGLLYTMARGDDGAWRIKDRASLNTARVEVK